MRLSELVSGVCSYCDALGDLLKMAALSPLSTPLTAPGHFVAAHMVVCPIYHSLADPFQLDVLLKLF